jgi:4-amino-4-deoxy-L-arabinose transferase-like glycosyltransferase
MSEITKTKDQNPKSKIVWIIFALIVVAVYLTGLTIPLLGPDEPRYAEVAREMFERGDWVTPKLGGFDWFEKPALLYWLQIVSYKLFGVTEFAARFGSALFGLGTVFCLWILGRNYPQINTDEHGLEIQNPKSKIQSRNDFANWLALIAASSIGLIVFSHGASFDIILTFPITASLVGFFVFDVFPQRREDAKEDNQINQKATENSLNSFKSSRLRAFAGLFAFYFFIGVALIAKGLVGIVFPFAIVAFYFLLSRKFPSKTFIFSLFWGTIVTLLVAAVWYVPMYQTNSWKFIDEFFIQHHFQRYTSNKYQHPQPFYFFFWVLPLMTIPWLPFFLASIWNLVKRIISRKDTKTQSKNLPFSSSPLLLFSIAWLLVPLVFFSISGSKLPGYILPALPAALILTAEYVWRFVQKSVKRRVFVQILALLMFIIVAIISQFVISNFLHEETVKHLVDTANSQGYTSEKILNLHTISHSAEFYGAGRLVREADGKQRRFYGVPEIVEEMKRENTHQVLVLTPLVYLNYLTKSELVESKVLDDNGELAIVVVKLKSQNSER